MDREILISVAIDFIRNRHHGYMKDAFRAQQHLLKLLKTKSAYNRFMMKHGDPDIDYEKTIRAWWNDYENII